MGLKEISVVSRSKSFDITEFQMQANVITWYYFNNLTPIKIPNLNKLTIQLTDEIGNFENYRLIPPFKVIQVCSYERYFDFESYLKLDYPKRKALILDTIIESIRTISEELSWDIEPFNKAYEKLISSDIEIKFPLTKITSARNRKNKGYLEVKFIDSYALIYLVVLDELDSIQKKIDILKVLPHQMYIFRIAASGKWLNNEEYIMSNPGREINHIINSITGDVKLQLDTKVNTEQDLIEELKIVSTEGNREEKLQLLRDKLLRLTDGKLDINNMQI